MIDARIQIRYTQTPQHEACAGVIVGSSVDAWLAELGRWGLPPEALELYVLPRSRQARQASGLFVVFRNGRTPAETRIFHPYGRVGAAFYLPVDASLEPAMSEEEIGSFHKWHCQVLHPAIGLIGFDQNDRLTSSQLLARPRRVERNWFCARPGLEAPPRLTAVLLERSTDLDSFFDAGKDDIGSDPLDALSESGPRNAVSDAAGQLAEKLLRGAGSFAERLQRAGNAPAQSSGSGRGEWPGLLQRFGDWAQNRADVLKRMREREVNRLLNMFKTDPDTALRFALPLEGGRFASRGKATPGGLLGPRDANFNLNALGGGRPVDSWDIDGPTQWQLSQEYRRATEREMALKHWRRAAYIFAHLLGDYHSAAQALEQGGHYREAAELYVDYLNKKEAAADCLRRGGLLLEAIEIYTELKRWETVGELYEHLDRREEAQEFYCKAVAQALAQHDHLDASRICERRLHDRKQALETLWAAWPSSAQVEQCLNRYFELLGRDGNHKQSRQKLKEMVNDSRGGLQSHIAVNVMAKLQKSYPERELREELVEHAYTVIGRELKAVQAEKRHSSLLLKLPGFVPHDPLLRRDCDRYAHQRKPELPVQRPARFSFGNVRKPFRTLTIERNVHWCTAKAIPGGLVALGARQNQLLLVRSDWEAKHHILSWTEPAATLDYLNLIVHSSHEDVVVPTYKGLVALPQRVLEPNVDFDNRLIASIPPWMPNDATAIAFDEHGSTITMRWQGDAFVLCTYSPFGEILSTNSLPGLPYTHQAFLQSRRGYTFIAFAGFMLSWREKGHSQELPEEATCMAASPPFTATRIAVGTKAGCVLAWPELGRFAHVEILAKGQHVVDVCITPDSHLIVGTNARRAIVYFLEDKQAKEICELETGHDICAVLPTGDRNHCAVFSTNGAISLFNIES